MVDSGEPLKPNKDEQDIKLAQVDSKLKYSLGYNCKYQLIFD